MKKSILICLSTLVLLIGGFLVKTKMVDADSFIPNMQLNLDKDESIEALVDREFEVAITIVPEDMKYSDVKNNIINNVYLEFESTVGLEIKKAKIGEKEFLASDNKINIDDIVYEDTKDKETIIAKPINVILTYKANIVGEFNGVGEIKLFYDENERKENKGQGSKVLSKSNKPLIKVGELSYKVDYITAKSEELKTVGLNEFFNLEYTINNGSLIELDSEGNNKEGISEESFENRDLIYVIDRGAIDLVGGNDEIAKDAIKKSLKELKKINPDTQTSLVVYGEEAEIISIDKKSKFSIDTLISAIDKIETSNKSGNLGDGIRKAKYLVNENSTSKSSIVIVSAGNPNYYTEISEGNTSMFETRVDKTGVNKEDKEKAEEYANNIVNDIIINEEDETRWYGINYGVEKEELLLNDLIDKFEGNIPNIKKPYYDDFISINKKATALLAIKGRLIVTPNPDSGIVVHDDEQSKDIEILFTKGVNGLVVEPINTKIQIKIEELYEDEYIDVANPGNLEVKLIVDFNDKRQETIFNKRIEGDMETDLNFINWFVNVKTPYIAKVGLFNGEYNVSELSVDERTVEMISSKVLEEMSEVKLAVENHYAFGMVIKGNIPLEIEGTLIDKNGEDEDININVYELNENGEFLTAIEVDDDKRDGTDDLDEFDLTASKIYLVVVNKYIENAITPPDSYQIGIEVEIDDDNKTRDIDDEDDDEFLGITVHPVPKPDHF